MAKTRIKAAVISMETFLQAILINLKNEFSLTPDIRRTIQAPDAYDCGARLFGMEKNGLLEKKVSPSGGSNMYRLTKNGKERLLKNGHLVQTFGHYDVVTVEDRNDPQMILGTTYSSVADQAMSELGEIIGRNSVLKGTITNILGQIDLVLGEV